MDAFPASASRTQARGSSQRSGSEASAESKEARPSHVPAILGPGASFSGLLAFSGEVRLEGTLEGEVVARGKLWIGEHARVKGSVETDELVVAGELEGDVIARRRLELLPTARLEGSLCAPTVVLAEGAYLRGHCRTADSTDAEEAEESLPPSP